MWDCTACAACCREAFDTVPVEDDDRVTLARRADWIETDADGWRHLRRVPVASGCGTRCAALEGDGPFHCVIYEDRPSACSGLDAGSEACLFARRRLGLDHSSGAV